MSKLNLRRAAMGVAVPVVLFAAACTHSGETLPPPEPSVAEERVVPEPGKTSEELEQEAVAEWEAFKAENSWEDRLEAMELSEDPGPDPDPEAVWMRSGRPYNIHKFEKKSALFGGAPVGWVRPFRGVFVQAEIYRDDDEHVWVWLDAVEQIAPEVRRHQERYPIRDLSGDRKRAFTELREEFEVFTPPAGRDVIRFVESSAGLPQTGSWRNSLAVADMNGDGHFDIVVPPQRGAFMGNPPIIFLGDGAGNWTGWREARWPSKQIDYGAVRAADFNGDGHMDLAFAVHLRGVLVFLGDGKGGFTDSSNGLPESTFPTRRIEIADVDGDGAPDIVALTEGPELDISTKRVEKPKMRVFRNNGRGTEWTEYEVGEAERYFGGDWLGVGNFNGDGIPDFVAASHAFHGRDIVWLSEGEMNWVPFGRGFFPRYSYVGAVAAGKVTSTELDDAIVSFTRYWSRSVNPEEIPHPEIEEVSGIELVSFAGAEPVRKPVIRWASNRPTWAMAAGDINGDGHTDIVYTRKDPAENGILLGDGAGNFRRATIEGWEFVANTTYDLTLADVNGDGKLDLLIMFENASKQMNVRDGSIRVFLNQTE